MAEETLKLLQRLGEDTAHLFKGLYKESDWLECQYKIYLSIPIFFSIVALGFNQELPGIWIKILAVISLISVVQALLGKRDSSLLIHTVVWRIK